MEDRDAEEFVLVLYGYYKLLTNRELHVDLEKDLWTEDTVPTYHSRHAVFCAPWSYVPNSNLEVEKYVDFASTPQFIPSDEASNSDVNSSLFYSLPSMCIFTTDE